MVRLLLPIITIQALSACVIYRDEYQDGDEGWSDFPEEQEFPAQDGSERPSDDQASDDQDLPDRPDAETENEPRIWVTVDPGFIYQDSISIVSLLEGEEMDFNPWEVESVQVEGPSPIEVLTTQARDEEFLVVLEAGETAEPGWYGFMITFYDGTGVFQAEAFEVIKEGQEPSERPSASQGDPGSLPPEPPANDGDMPDGEYCP